MKQIKKITNEEFKEFKVLALFFSAYKSSADFDEIAFGAMGYAVEKYNEELITSDDFSIEKIDTNLDMIKALFFLTDKALSGENEAKEMANLLIEAFEGDNIEIIPKSARLGLLLEIDPRKESFIGVRERTILRALNEDDRFRHTIDMFNLEFEDIGVYDWIRNIDSLVYSENDNDKPLLVESYTGGKGNCAIRLNRNIKTKNLLGYSVNYRHDKIDNNSIRARRLYTINAS